MEATDRSSAHFGHFVLGVRRAAVPWADRLLQRARTRLGRMAAWRPSRQGRREALAVLVGAGVIAVSMFVVDEIGALAA